MSNCGFSSGFSSGFDVCPPGAARPPQAPSSAGVAHPSLADPTLLARPEGKPLRELDDAGAALRRRLKA